MGRGALQALHHSFTPVIVGKERAHESPKAVLQGWIDAISAHDIGVVSACHF
jgi:hypothetical protein